LTAAFVLRIEPRRSWASPRFRELWDYRELLYFFVWRDVKVRYKQTALGAAWALLQPFFSMVVFTIFLGRLAKLPSDGIPYPIFTYTALAPWMFFSNGVAFSSNCLVGSANMLKKVYFPRLILPAATVVAGLVDLAISMLLLLALMLYYGVAPKMNMVWLPVFVLLALTVALGCGLWLAALNVYYRDVRYAVPFLMQIWLFATPVVYPSSLIREPWRTLYGLNPMTGVVEGFRWAALGIGKPQVPMTLVSAAVAALILFGGILYFRHRERSFADVV